MRPAYHERAAGLQLTRGTLPAALNAYGGCCAKVCREAADGMEFVK